MYSPITGTGDGTAPVVNITFAFLQKANVKARADGVDVPFTWTGASQITFADPVDAGIAWEVYRETAKNSRLTDFTDGSVLTEADLDLDSNQAFYRTQELQGQLDNLSRDVEGITPTLTALYDAGNVLKFGATGDGVTDDTAAFAAAFTAAKKVYAPAGTYRVDQIVIPSNRELITDGFLTVFQQNPGQPSATSIVKIIGSTVRLGAAKYVGNIATDADEWNYAVEVRSDVGTEVHTVFIGDIWAKDIRGDGLALIGRGSISNVRYSNVLLDNVYRNGVSVVGTVTNHIGDSVKMHDAATRGAGYMEFLIESDVGTGMVGRGYIDYVKGRYAASAGPTEADGVESMSFGEVDLDITYHPGSNPAYPITPPAAFQVRNTKSLSFARFKSANSVGSALMSVAGEMNNMAVFIGSADIPSGNTGGAASGVIVVGSGVELEIAHLVANGHATGLFTGTHNARIGRAAVSLDAGEVFLRYSYGVKVGSAEVTGVGQIITGGFDNEINGGSLVGDSLFAFTEGANIVRNATVTVTSPFLTAPGNHVENTTLNGTFYRAYEPNVYTVDEDGNITSGLLSTKGLSAGVNLWSRSAGETHSLYVDSGALRVYVNGADRLIFSDSGNLTIGGSVFSSGFNTANDASVYKVNGTQVVGPRQAAIANDASGAVNQATVNAILAALRTHGLIAP